MDDLLREFLTETSEHLDVVDIELVRFEQDPNNEQILRNIFRLVHTIKGTCGFLSLPRLETLAHAAETLMGRFRDGLPVTSDAVSLILATIDRIKDILAALERSQAEPLGSDEDLIGEMEVLSSHAGAHPSGVTVGQLTYQVLERPLMPGEDTLDGLERVFRETPGPGEIAAAQAPADVAVQGLRAGLPAGPEPARKPAPVARNGRAGEAPAAKLARIQTIRVTVDTLEHLMTMVSELVLTRNQLLDLARRQDDNAFKVPLQRLSHVTAELQEGVMKTRMQPIGSAWQQLPRLVRDVAGELGKHIDLVMLGSETELDRQVLEIIKDPLTHMIRNSADHGIELPAERRARGKPERGTIRLVAWHEGGTISIEVGDDGRGIDQAAIRRAIADRGLAGELEVERMSDAQAAKFIFHPGFSTARAVTPISGRGVGMDVVKTNVELIGGTVDVLSDAGRGTTFTIKIPLTLAIIAALIVVAGGQRFAVPQVAVLELVRVRPGSDHVIERINGTPVLRLRDRLLPVVSLVELLAMAEAGEARRDNGFIVVLQVGRQHFGVLVDGVFHTEEIVVKPMSKKLRHIPFFSGNTILGDGAVVLIIDPNGVSRMIGAAEVEASRIAEETAEAEPAEDDVTTTLLIFRAGGAGCKAVPLSLVTRLEEIDTKRIEWVAGKPLLQYRGRLMPLIPASATTAIRAEGVQPIVVFADGERSMGLVVDEIVDIVEEKFDIDLIAERPDVLGSAVVRGVATEIVNVGYFLPLAHEDWLKRGVAPVKAASRTVLFVDDSAFFRDMLTPVLRAAGYRVLLAGNADEALATLRSGGGVDVMVTDIEMPGLSGFDLVEVIRRDPALAKLPVIALSSYLSRAAVESARRLGIVDFVAKFDRSGLLAALSEAIPSYGAAA